MKYKKKPVVIEAVQFTYPPTEELLSFCPALSNFRKDRHIDAVGYADIETLEGVLTATENDYIIKGVEGEFYACKKGIFHQTYDPVKGGE